MKYVNRRKKQAGLTMVFAALALVALVPMLGLVVDVGFVYGAKTQLQASVDGAALAGARAMVLDTSSTSTTNTVNNATTWFWANFPTGTWNTTNISLTAPSVYEDCSPPTGPQNANGCNLNLWHVNVTASAQAPTFFMRWFGATATTISATGAATRRNVVAMLVLDRSGSMCGTRTGTLNAPCTEANTAYACSSMITAAKTFVGQFANGRDYLGMVTFNSGVNVTSPTQNFRTGLGYTDPLGNSGSGAIDNITCQGGTGTTAALSVAYNELYKQAQAGALNVILLETDGLPNTLALNWWDSSNSVSGISGNSNCQDKNSKTKTNGGWATAAAQRTWFSTSAFPGTTYPTVYSSGAYYTAPTGPYGSYYTSDPWQGQYYTDMSVPWQKNDSNNDVNLNSVGSAVPGCTFTTTGSISPTTTGSTQDVAWWPNTDIFGNSLNPPSCSSGVGPCAYNNPTYGGAPITTGSPSHIEITASNATTAWHSAKSAVENALDNAGYNIRADTSLKPVIYTIGLDGNTGDPPDLILLQRLANDSTMAQTACVSPPAAVGGATAFPSYTNTTHCLTYTAQQQGKFIYSPSKSQLNQAFLALSSQMLRLAQ